MAHLQLLRGGLGRISDSVSAGRVDASQERVAVGVASRIMCRLGAQFPHRGRKLGAVVLASPPGEYHGLPLALVANLIRHAGFVVIELGIDTPATDLVSTVERVEDLVAVGIGVSAVERVDAAVEMIAQLREAHPTVPVLLGGQAIRNADIAEMVGASSWSAGPDLVETLRVLAVERRRAARQVQSI